MKTSEEIAQAVITEHCLQPHWVRSTEQIRGLLVEAVNLDRELCGNTLVNDERDIEVGIWPSAKEDSTDADTIVVQIDTGDNTRRVRVNLNDGVVWDGDPGEDDIADSWTRSQILAELTMLRYQVSALALVAGVTFS